MYFVGVLASFNQYITVLTVINIVAFPVYGYYKESYYQHLYTSLSLLSGKYLRVERLSQYSMGVLNFYRNCQIII